RSSWRCRRTRGPAASFACAGAAFPASRRAISTPSSPSCFRARRPTTRRKRTARFRRHFRASCRAPDEEDDAMTMPIVEVEYRLTLVELCHACDAREEDVRAWVDEGALEPEGARPGEWRF